MESIERKYFHFKGEVYEVTKWADGLWRGRDGCIYALADDKFSVDKEVRAGIGWLSFPKGHPANEAAGPHDYAYSCPAYQAFHTRSEADADMKRNFELLGEGAWWGSLAPLWHCVVRLVGGLFWEDDDTRND